MRPIMLRRFSAVFLVAGAVLCTGCVPVLPENAKTQASPRRVVSYEAGGATFSSEEGLEDGYWVEVERSSEAGSVGGYLSGDRPHRGALMILMHGASTFVLDGEIGSARMFHDESGPVFWELGYRTWSLAVRECGTAYGQGDFADVLEAIDWLDGGGKDLLGIERVYMLGYSAGGTLTTLVNRHRKLTALASLSGFTQPDQLEAGWGFYRFLASLFPNNVGMCQLIATLDYYGPAGSGTWQFLDSVTHLGEFQSPMLIVHGTDDLIVNVANALELEARYLELLGVGTVLPSLEFMYVPGGHSAPLERSDVKERVVAFFEQFEPPWSPPAAAAE